MVHCDGVHELVQKPSTRAILENAQDDEHVMEAHAIICHGSRRCQHHVNEQGDDVGDLEHFAGKAMHMSTVSDVYTILEKRQCQFV